MKPSIDYGLTEDQRALLDKLGEAQRVTEDAERDRRELVIACRMAECSWELIARELGTTRQGAWERYRHEPIPAARPRRLVDVLSEPSGSLDG